MLLVDPATFFHIKFGGRADDAIETESLNDFRDGHHLGLIFWRPPEQCEEIEHSFGKIAIGAVTTHSGSGVAFAHLGSIGIKNERNMTVLGWLHTKGFEELKVFRRVHEVILTTQHVADLHFQIIDHINKVEYIRPV